MTSKISIVIPALNEEKGIAETIKNIPVEELKSKGYEIEIIVIDNGSIDRTGIIAEKLGAIVVYESKKGYGTAYKAGFNKVNGDIIITCDADGTYPVKDIPRLVWILNNNNLEFLNTNRFLYMKNGSMSKRNKIGNKILTVIMNKLYGIEIKDSQSGMWIFRRELLDRLNLEYTDWIFSQELKIEACYYAGCKYSEVPIEYYKRIGNVRLNGWVVGFKDLYYMIKKRIRR